MLNWPGSAASITGWRWESIDTHIPPNRFATFVGEGDHTTIGHTMPSFPQPGQWSAPARCWRDGGRQEWNWRHGGEAPVEGCVCGYRVCRTLQTACRYLFPFNRLAYLTNESALVLVRVETQGKLVGNDFDSNLGPWNCVSANQIRPLWPAYVINETAAQLLREHYGTGDIHVLDEWAEAGKQLVSM